VTRLRALTEEYRQLAERLRAGGGPARVAKMHQQGKLAPRERVTRLLDPGAPWLELGLLVAYDQYDGQAPGAVPGWGQPAATPPAGTSVPPPAAPPPAPPPDGGAVPGWGQQSTTAIVPRQVPATLVTTWTV